MACEFHLRVLSVGKNAHLGPTHTSEMRRGNMAWSRNRKWLTLSGVNRVCAKLQLGMGGASLSGGSDPTL